MLHLGKNLWRVGLPPAYLDPRDLLGNAWLLGQGETTSLLEHLAWQLVNRGQGLAYIDPLGTSVRFIMDILPRMRIGDTLFVDPFSSAVIPWNPLEDLGHAHERVASEMVHLLENMLDGGSFLYRSQDLLKMCILSLAHIPDATLLLIPKLLQNDAWRRKMVVPFLDPTLYAFWEQEYENWIKERQRSTAIAPLMNKLRIFTTSSPLKDMLCSRSVIQPSDIIRQQKILLCDLQRQELGELETRVLASLFLARLNWSCNQPYFVLINNGEYIAAGILASALANPSLGVILMNTYGAQIDFDAVMGHTQNLFVFQTNMADARQFENVFPPNVQVRYLVDQRPETCYAKLGNRVLNLEVLPPLGVTPSKMKERVFQ